MNVMRRRFASLEEFLDWEDRQEAKYEFDGVQAILMAGGTEEQAEIQSNLLRVIGNRLVGHRCRILGSELKIKVMGHIRYPDAFVVCSPRERGRKVVPDPVIVFEILSDSSRHTDLVEKNEEYRETDSVRRYVVLEQTHVGGVMFHRAPDGAWVQEALTGRDAMVDLPEIGVRLPLIDVYEGVFDAR